MRLRWKLLFVYQSLLFGGWCLWQYLVGLGLGGAGADGIADVEAVVVGPVEAGAGGAGLAVGVVDGVLVAVLRGFGQ